MSPHEQTRIINKHRDIGLLVPFNTRKCRAYQRYMLEVLAGPAIEIRPHGGVNVPKKSKDCAAAAPSGGEATAAPAGGDGAGSGDDDSGDGDGDGDSDGPRQLPHSRFSIAPSLISAARRLKTPLSFLRHVCACVAFLALLFPYYQLALSAFLAERGHASLASEVLYFKPVVLVQMTPLLQPRK